MEDSAAATSGALRQIGLREFRCFASIDVKLSAGANLLVGPNGAGKTSLLEAIFFLSRGRSFRSGDLDHLRRTGSTALQVFGVVNTGQRAVPLGVERVNRRNHPRCDGQPAANAATLAEVLPVLLIDPRSHLLVEGGPAVRRQFLDWGAFHVEHRFIGDWRRYQRALRQRNALLKQKVALRALSPWNAELATAGVALDGWRRQFLDTYVPVLQALVPELIQDVAVDLQYRRGWASQVDFETALTDATEADLERGTTSVGPHRADLGIRWNGAPAQEHVSRGQQKLLAVAMLLAQARVYSAQHGRNCLLLIDDPVAELDQAHLQRFLRLLGQLSTQTIITCVDSTLIDTSQLHQLKMFHVEQATIREMVQ